MTVAQIVTAALQFAIAAHRNGKTVEQAVIDCRTRYWREYTPENQAAANRAIQGYFSRAQTPKPEVKPEPKQVTQVELVNPAAFAKNVVENSGKMTKEQLIAAAERAGVKIAKSWPKAKILEAIQKKAA